MKVLLTAFDPFGGDTVNPALEAVRQVAKQVGEVEIVKREVPTVFVKSIAAVVRAIQEEKPDAVLCVGQAGGRIELTPERVAINLDDARIPDNAGNQPMDQVIFQDGENAYFATLPIKAMVSEIRAAGLPASVSNSAGTFVCNHLMYGVLYHLSHDYPKIRGGFIHVPYIPSQVAGLKEPAPSMALSDIVRGLEAAVRAIGNHERDIAITGGREW